VYFYVLLFDFIGAGNPIRLGLFILLFVGGLFVT